VPDTTNSQDADLKIGAVKPGRDTRSTVKNVAKNVAKSVASKDGAEPGNFPRETELLRQTIAMLKAELEIRDEQLDLLGIQLELSREEVRNLRHLLSRQLDSVGEQVQNRELWMGNIQLSGPVHQAELPGPMRSMPPVAIAVRTAGGENSGSLAQPPVPVVPAPGVRSSYFREFSKSFRPCAGLMSRGFSLPLFH
jgi:hypothetical protein